MKTRLIYLTAAFGSLALLLSASARAEEPSPAPILSLSATNPKVQLAAPISPKKGTIEVQSNPTDAGDVLSCATAVTFVPPAKAKVPAVAPSPVIEQKSQSAPAAPVTLSIDGVGFSPETPQMPGKKEAVTAPSAPKLK